MSHKQPKKKRPSPMFSMEAVEARINSKTTLLRDIRQHIQTLKEVDLKILVKTHFSELGEDDAIHLLTSKISMQGLIYLKLAAKHVPKNITRHINGVSLRISLICKIFNEVTSCEMPKLSIEEVDLYLSFADKYCPNYLSSEESMEELWSVSEPEELFFTRFLTPPVSTCLRCDKSLAMHNNPSKAKIFTLDGPIPCTKVKLECKECAIQYGVAKFTDDLGSHFYSSEFDIDFVEVTNVTYVDLRLYRWMPSLSNHCWVSFSGFSEAYNDVYENEIIKYCNMAGSFKVDSEETGDETNIKAGASGGELSAKTVAKCFWLREVEEELQSNGLREKWVFATKKDGEFSGTNDDAMEALDRKRCDELYSHNCSDHCKQKGCGCLYVADGNWKLRYAHCMWKVPIKLAGFGDINYPCICPISPKRGHAFCEEHCEKAELLGYPTELRKFLKRCGISDGGVTEVLDEISSKALLTETSLQSVNTCLEEYSKLDSGNESCNASTFQGTTDFLTSNPGFVEDQTQEDDTQCNKDTGGLKSLQCWSRGMFFIVSAGGHIDYWQPLYRSESPTQAYVVMVLWLYRKFSLLLEQGYSDEAIKECILSTCLAYDNMCHVDSLKLSKNDLPFPKPLNKAWKLLPKVIDRLHLRNHVDPKCKKLYNADDKLPPSFNTMACEQTFIWASRYKKIMCAMPHLHQFFFLHRIVKYRNKYTEKCHLNHKDPVLPKLGKNTNPS